MSVASVLAAWPLCAAPASPAPASATAQAEAGPAAGRPAAGEREASEAADGARLRRAVEWLADPAREGRGPGTKGIDEAGGWIAGEMRAIGLVPVDTTPAADDVAQAGFQPFEMTLDARLGPAAENRAELVGPTGPNGVATTIPLVLETDFTPLAAGGSGPFDLPLVFGGYGITAPA
ncbi:MAG: hypothetical protein ACKOTB_17945, partial [Planctomycetia bacterium]